MLLLELWFLISKFHIIIWSIIDRVSVKFIHPVLLFASHVVNIVWYSKQSMFEVQYKQRQVKSLILKKKQENFQETAEGFSHTAANVKRISILPISRKGVCMFFCHLNYDGFTNYGRLSFFQLPIYDYKANNSLQIVVSLHTLS